MTSLLVLRAVGGGIVVDGSTCPRGCMRSATPVSRCAVCGSQATAATFGPAGHVWASTVVHVPAGERPPGRRVAFVDLLDGPRIVCDLSEPAPIGTRVRLSSTTDSGDPLAVLA